MIRKLLPALLLLASYGASIAQTAETPAKTTTAPTAAVGMYSLKRTSKVGDTIKYKLTVKANAGGIDATLTAASEDKVTKVTEAGGYTLDQTWSDSKLDVGGTAQDGPTIQITYTYGPSNELLDLTGKDVEEQAKTSFVSLDTLKSLRLPGKPVKVGDTWTVEIAPTDANAKVGAHLEYKLDGEEKLGTFDTLRIKLTGKLVSGGDATSEMTIWVSKTDFSMVKTEGTASKLPFANVPFPIDAKITIVREGA